MSVVLTGALSGRGGRRLPFILQSKTTLTRRKVRSVLNVDMTLVVVVTRVSKNEGGSAALLNSPGWFFATHVSFRRNAAMIPDVSKSSCIGMRFLWSTGWGIDPEQAPPPPAPVQNAV